MAFTVLTHRAAAILAVAGIETFHAFTALTVCGASIAQRAIFKTGVAGAGADVAVPGAVTVGGAFDAVGVQTDFSRTLGAVIFAQSVAAAGFTTVTVVVGCAFDTFAVATDLSGGAVVIFGALHAFTTVAELVKPTFISATSAVIVVAVEICAEPFAFAESVTGVVTFVVTVSAFAHR